MGLPIIGDVIDLVDGAIDKIWPDKDTVEKAKADVKTAIITQAMQERKLLFEDTKGARQLFEQELRAQNTPKWARAIQVLGRQFALYGTVSLYIYSKISVHIGFIFNLWRDVPIELPTITLNERDYWLIGTVFIFLFGARSVEKLFRKE